MTYDKKIRVAWDPPFSRAREQRTPINFVPRPAKAITCSVCGAIEPKPRTPNQKRCNECCDKERWGKK